MQFSKTGSQLARLCNVEPKDVLFAMLTTAGASAAEAFAVIYRPGASTNNALSSKASIFISQRPGLQRLQAALLNVLARPADRSDKDSDLTLSYCCLANLRRA